MPPCPFDHEYPQAPWRCSCLLRILSTAWSWWPASFFLRTLQSCTLSLQPRSCFATGRPARKEVWNTATLCPTTLVLGLEWEPCNSQVATTYNAGPVDMRCGRADGRTGPAVLAACAARCWVARSAAGIKLARNRIVAAAPACTSLVACLPALEDAKLFLCAPVIRADLGCLLEALAWCPRLRALDLYFYPYYHMHEVSGHEDMHWPFPAPALARLSGLVSLALQLGDSPYALADVVGALGSMMGLTALHLGAAQEAVLPASLGQLKALRSLGFSRLIECVLEAGCFDLPKLQSLEFSDCEVPDAAVLPGIGALQSLTRVAFQSLGPLVFDAQLAQLPRLQCLTLSQKEQSHHHVEPLRLPAVMGSLTSSLLHLDISGHAGGCMPPAMTKLVALQHLNCSESTYEQLPAGITALSRLTELVLGGVLLETHSLFCLDARALGDLSSFPALRRLTFDRCRVTLSPSIPGAARHTSLTSLRFDWACPARESEPAVLQLGQELERLGRGRVLSQWWAPVR